MPHLRTITPTLLDELYAAARNYDRKFPGARKWLEEILKRSGGAIWEMRNPESSTDVQEIHNFRRLVARNEKFENDMKNFERRVHEHLCVRKTAKQNEEANNASNGAGAQARRARVEDTADETHGAEAERTEDVGPGVLSDMLRAQVDGLDETMPVEL